MRKRVTFSEPFELPRLKDATEYLFPFCVTELSSTTGSHHQTLSTKHTIRVGITTSLLIVWRLPNESVKKLLFHYACENIKQRIKTGTLSEEQELLLATHSVSNVCPIDLSTITDNVTNYSFELDNSDSYLK